MCRCWPALFFLAFVCAWTVLPGQSFRVEHDPVSGLLNVYGQGIDSAVITQNAKEGIRPYLHPIRTPGGGGVLTEIHPDHHPHQTGVYWGLKKVNGRDYFTNYRAGHYQRQSVLVLQPKGKEVKWQTVYNLLDEQGEPILQETHTWSVRQEDSRMLLDLEWQGKALTQITVEQFFVGGLFMRMPWSKDIQGEAVNSLGETNREAADGHRAIWTDVGMQISGMKRWGHIAILDHPDNTAFPTPWRVDGQLGVGPSRQILGDWSLAKGEVTTERYRLIIYEGDLNRQALTSLWKDYVCE